MAKRRIKKRTHARPGLKASNNGGNATTSMTKSPKTMVIRMGASDVGRSVTQLTRDVRQMMEPDTASRLRVSFAPLSSHLSMTIDSI
ncbi:hypothetical protein KEM55_004740 [Ascosphaera atra]|nr:hypothetical protein KEM55_004740 [Ascosphaera atra]